jgi:hypothetical protein
VLHHLSDREFRGASLCHNSNLANDCGGGPPQN